MPVKFSIGINYRVASTSLPKEKRARLKVSLYQPPEGGICGREEMLFPTPPTSNKLHLTWPLVKMQGKKRGLHRILWKKTTPPVARKPLWEKLLQPASLWLKRPSMTPLSAENIGVQADRSGAFRREKSTNSPPHYLRKSLKRDVKYCSLTRDTGGTYAV